MSYCSLLTYTNKDLKSKVKVRVAVRLPQTLDREQIISFEQTSAGLKCLCE